MPLRDHFHPPLTDRTSWDGFHGGWPMVMVQKLNALLPARFVAAPMIHLGSEIEIDVASFDQQNEKNFTPIDHQTSWQLSDPSMVIETELLKVDNYEVQIFDENHNRKLVATVEIVSPSNKDRPESRQTFVAKCEALLKKGVSVAIVDIVTNKHFNLYIHLLELIGETDSAFEPEPSSIYAVACRWIPRGRKHYLETWSHKLQIGQPLPTLPLWLAENFYVPLDLEATYEETCRALRIS
jgi:hypothetical protein